MWLGPTQRHIRHGDNHLFYIHHDISLQPPISSILNRRNLYSIMQMRGKDVAISRLKITTRIILTLTSRVRISRREQDMEDLAGTSIAAFTWCCKLIFFSSINIKTVLRHYLRVTQDNKPRYKALLSGEGFAKVSQAILRFVRPEAGNLAGKEIDIEKWAILFECLIHRLGIIDIVDDNIWRIACWHCVAC